MTHGSIKANETVEAVYDNSSETPCSTEGDGSLTITKMVSGDGAEKDRAFTFVVTFDDGGSYDCRKCNGEQGTINGSGEITLKPGQRATFDQITPGTHYTVTETPGTGPQTPDT